MFYRHLLKMSLVLSLIFSCYAAAAAAKIVKEDFTIASPAPGIELYMRHKHLQGKKAKDPNKILLFVHGATYPSETSFDLPIEGVSMMDLFAAKGFDVYLVDVRGYGRSTRMKALDEPADANPPLVHTREAADDLGAAVDHILKKHGVSKINLMGWSWGTSIVGMYTSEHNDKVNRVVLYAPMWLFRQETGVPTSTNPAKALPAYRLVSKDSAKGRWLKGVAEQKVKGLIPPGVFEQWAKETWATDPKASESGNLRAPNGVIDDVMTYWMKGKPTYDPALITAPTFLIHAEWDADLPMYQAQGLFAELKNVPYKRYVEISEGTHTVMLEKNRMQFFREIHLFLDETHPLALK